MKTIVITGANRGIGLGLVREFLKQGHRVIAGCRHPDQSQALETTRRDFVDRCHVETVDVTQELSLRGFAERCRSFGDVNVLVNNAGVLRDRGTRLSQLDLQAIRESFEVNSFAPLMVTKIFMEQLHSHAVVAHITSKMGSITDNTSGGYYAYRASKAALNMFNKSLSIDFPEKCFLTLHPGWVKTDMGGDQAPTTVEESARGLVRVIMGATAAQSGHFFDFQGEVIPW
jgi:NAD(P)-dependent dehydrogenase (short-subunit alcohol dehydrogenase family)